MLQVNERISFIIYKKKGQTAMKRTVQLLVGKVREMTRTLWAVFVISFFRAPTSTFWITKNMVRYSSTKRSKHETILRCKRPTLEGVTITRTIYRRQHTCSIAARTVLLFHLTERINLTWLTMNSSNKTRRFVQRKVRVFSEEPLKTSHFSSLPIYWRLFRIQ